MDKVLMLKELMKFYNLQTRKQFADKVGITEQNAYTWFKRGVFIPEIIYETCPEISGDWLLSGEGEIRRNITQTINGGTNNNNVAGDINNEVNVKMVDTLREQQELTAKAQAQADRLIAIIEKMTDSQ